MDDTQEWIASRGDFKSKKESFFGVGNSPIDAFIKLMVDEEVNEMEQPKML